MSFTEKLLKVDELQQQINRYGALPDNVLKKINYKFRLEWNYTSNSMEGNTLTKLETRTVMIGNITVNGKPIKDVLEMKGHDEVVNSIIKMGKDQVNISEKRIKEIHTGIMHEENPEKKKMIGHWKTEPNYLYNYKDERFDFTAPADVPDSMHRLVNWLNAEKEKITRNAQDALHSVELALKFHLDYVTIHPFHDGNGRTSRILTNIILISYGYPPIYVKENERDGYYQYLGDIQGYGGTPDIFFDYMAGLLIRSQQLVIDAIEGKDIEEADDLDKKLQLLEIELNNIHSDNEIKIKYSEDVFFDIYSKWASKLITAAVPIIQKFNRFFAVTNHHISIFPALIQVEFGDEQAEIIANRFFIDVEKNLKKIGQLPVQLKIVANYHNLIKGGLQTFDCSYAITIKFNEIAYEVWVDDVDDAGKLQAKKYERLLHQELMEDEINDVVKALGNAIYKHIDIHTRQKGLR